MKKIIATLALLLSFSAFAEQYKVIVPFAAGSTPDVQARKILDVVSKNTKDVFIIINKPGAETLIGYKQFLEDSDKDKNTLFFSHSSYYIGFLSNDENSIDKNTKPVAVVQKFTYSLVTRKDASYTTMSDVKGKKNIGGTTKLCLRAIEAVKKDSDLQFISYKSDTEAFVELLQGSLDFVCTGSNSVAYASVREKTKTISGFNKDVDVGVTSAMVASKLMSDEQIARLNSAINQAYRDESLRNWFIEISGLPPEIGPAEGYLKHVRELKKFIDTHSVSIK
jgi:tripartite-type tricarboxylate transporter receptor subunit TctC